MLIPICDYCKKQIVDLQEVVLVEIQSPGLPSVLDEDEEDEDEEDNDARELIDTLDDLRYRSLTQRRGAEIHQKCAQLVTVAQLLGISKGDHPTWKFDGEILTPVIKRIQKK